jgi:filamentous hemagglutinin family protein
LSDHFICEVNVKKNPFLRIRFQPEMMLAAAVLAAAALWWVPSVLAAPYGGQVQSGLASISKNGAATDISQQTSKAIINWQGFSIGAGETVNFKQPSASSLTLNRVVGQEKSILNGALNANGRVFLVNSNGVLIGQGASVNTGGLVASALDISDADFKDNRFVFQAAGPGGEVINRGRISVPEGSFAVLLGGQVKNEGVILAEKGTVSLNGAQRAVLNFNGDSLVSVSLEEGAVSALVENKGAVFADGGQILLTAKAAGGLADAQVNTDGTLQAQTLGELSGRILVYAYGGTANVLGTLDASAPKGGNGGFIETSGDKVRIADSARVDTSAPQGKFGRWLIDPADFTVAASGGDITGSTLSLQLAGASVEIQSSRGSKNGSGDINILDGISWTADTILTLTAENDINIKAPVSPGGSGSGVYLIFGGGYDFQTPASFSGTELDPVTGYPVARRDTSGGLYGRISFGPAGGILKINGQTYIIIHSLSELDLLDGYNAQALSGTETAVSGFYALGRSLDASGLVFQDALVAEFDGIFTGLGNVIENLAFNIPSGPSRYTGLFGKAGLNDSSGMIRDIGLKNVSIADAANMYTGTLIGLAGSNVRNVYSTGSINSNAMYQGGLLGMIYSYGGPIAVSYSFADVTLASGGGLTASAAYVNFDHVHASGDIYGTNASYTGGLIGRALIVEIDNSYASGDVIANNWIGGMVGSFILQYSTGAEIYGSIKNSFASGKVTGSGEIGGLVGEVNMPNDGNKIFIVHNSYATGDVTSNGNIASNVGGLIGYLFGDGENSSEETARRAYITRAYASGDVTKNGQTGDAIGGLIGRSRVVLEISDSYASGNVRGGVETTYVGGLIGNVNGGSRYNKLSVITNCYATGSVWGAKSVGGLIGSNSKSEISFSYATGNVYGTYRSEYGNWGQIGGLVGENNSSPIRSSYATGDIYGVENSVGGIAGFFGGSMSDSYFTGHVYGEDGALLGGLTGMSGAFANIENSYFSADNNPGLGYQGVNQWESYPSVPVDVDSLGGDMLNDLGVINSILNGGDVQGAVSDYNERQSLPTAEQIEQDQLQQEIVRQNEIRQNQAQQEQLLAEQLRLEDEAAAAAALDTRRITDREEALLQNQIANSDSIVVSQNQEESEVQGKASVIGPAAGDFVSEEGSSALRYNSAINAVAADGQSFGTAGPNRDDEESESGN